MISLSRPAALWDFSLGVVLYGIQGCDRRDERLIEHVILKRGCWIIFEVKLAQCVGRPSIQRRKGQSEQNSLAIIAFQSRRQPRDVAFKQFKPPPCVSVRAGKRSQRVSQQSSLR